jgi:hypothetical protein
MRDEKSTTRQESVCKDMTTMSPLVVVNLTRPRLFQATRTPYDNSDEKRKFLKHPFEGRQLALGTCAKMLEEGRAVRTAPGPKRMWMTRSRLSPEFGKSLSDAAVGRQARCCWGRRSVRSQRFRVANSLKIKGRKRISQYLLPRASQFWIWRFQGYRFNICFAKKFLGRKSDDALCRKAKGCDQRRQERNVQERDVGFSAKLIDGDLEDDPVD